MKEKESKGKVRDNLSQRSSESRNGRNGCMHKTLYDTSPQSPPLTGTSGLKIPAFRLEPDRKQKYRCHRATSHLPPATRPTHTSHSSAPASLNQGSFPTFTACMPHGPGLQTRDIPGLQCVCKLGKRSIRRPAARRRALHHADMAQVLL